MSLVIIEGMSAVASQPTDDTTHLKYIQVKNISQPLTTRLELALATIHKLVTLAMAIMM